MAFTTDSATETRAFAWGPVKMEIQTFSCSSGDTTGSVTAKSLSRVDDCLLMASGTLCQTSAPSISGTTATLAFADPASACAGYSAQTIHGYILLIGR